MIHESGETDVVLKDGSLESYTKMSVCEQYQDVGLSVCLPINTKHVCFLLFSPFSAHHYIIMDIVCCMSTMRCSL